MTAYGKRLGKILVQSGVISDEQLENALAQAGSGSITTVLASLGYADEAFVARTVAESTGLQFIDLAVADVDAHAATLIPIEAAKRYHALPIRIEDEELVVAMSDPANVLAIDDLRIVTGYSVRPVVVTESDLMNALEKLSTAQTSVQDMMEDLEDSLGLDATEEDEEEEASDEDAPVAKLMNLVITEAVRQNAGNIYLEPHENDMRVRFRVDGVCQDILRSPKRMHRQLISRIKVASGMDIAEKRVPQDGRFSVSLEGKAVDFRVAVLPLVHGELAVMRLLQRDSIMMSLQDLGFHEGPLKHLREALELPYGAILVTGPTDSGKTTTLYAAINETNDPGTNLITVEDPVEYRLPGLSQVQVHEKAGLTFSAALRSILRQDPDTVMIGEIRDKETGTIAIEAALTGHLVLSTVHTNDAPSAITRLSEMGIEPFLTASAVTCVVAQRLARRLCSDCKEPYVPDEEALTRIKFPFEPGNPPRIFRAVGCKRCGGIGYRGRLGVIEVFSMSEEIERLTVSHSSTEVIREQAIAEGMQPLLQDGFAKVKMGLTSIEEIMRVVV